VKRFVPVALVAAFVVAGCSASDQSKANTDASAAATDAGRAVQQAGQAVGDALKSKPAEEFKHQLFAAGIKSRLVSSDLDAAANVTVREAAGVVTLSGRVHTAGEAEKLVGETKAMDGVKSVENRLVVDRSAPSAAESANDLALETRIRAALASETGANAFKISVKAHGGAVALAGAVGSEAIKSTIVATVKKTAGVRSLSETIAVHD
jgi:hyperosmotically inducible protein